MAGIPPLIIEAKEKEKYILFLANQDAAGFARFAEEAIIQKEADRIRAFKRNQYDPSKEYES